MKRLLMAGAACAAMLATAGFAEAQIYYPQPFRIAPAPPESIPAWSQDELSGTAQRNIAATPDCGAANPQGGIPSASTGNCP